LSLLNIQNTLFLLRGSHNFGIIIKIILDLVNALNNFILNLVLCPLEVKIITLYFDERTYKYLVKVHAYLLSIKEGFLAKIIVLYSIKKVK